MKSSHNKIPLLAILQYNNNQDKGGIYSITNIVTKRIYIGSTYWFKQRWIRHLNELRKGKHKNNFLQNDFKKYGEENYIFQILEIVEGTFDEIKNKEQKYLDELFSKTIHDERYNSARKVSGDGLRKQKNKTYKNNGKWFLSPDGIEYIIEDLEHFCKKLKLDFVKIISLNEKEINEYNGWIKIEESSNNIFVNKITKIEEIVNNILLFSKKYDLQQSHVSKVLSGKRSFVGDWCIKNRITFHKHYKIKT